MDELTQKSLAKAADFFDIADKQSPRAIVHESGKPIRLGALLDGLAADTASQADKTIRIHHFVLDVHQHELSGGERVIRLTEKETALLVLLNDAVGERVARKDLLQSIWNYGENTETHTLETHIYRLRQKIERDPATPEILLTCEDGYALGAV